jgi:predicted RNA-binding Zn-ribbon protein involved in translation (DUF1610 family)
MPYPHQWGSPSFDGAGAHEAHSQDMEQRMLTLDLRTHGERRKGSWWRAGGKTMWGCPKCGQAHILATHTVRDDGEVYPSVVCGKCDFHDYICLDEVQPEALTR